MITIFLGGEGGGEGDLGVLWGGSPYPRKNPGKWHRCSISKKYLGTIGSVKIYLCVR